MYNTPDRYDYVVSRLIPSGDTDFYCDGLPVGSSVLDLGCGTGRLSLEMARRGYEITGLELHSAMLTKARGLAQQERLSIHWTQGSFFDLEYQETFHRIIMAFGTFELILNSHQTQSFMKKALRALRSGADFRMDISNLIDSEQLSHLLRTMKVMTVPSFDIERQGFDSVYQNAEFDEARSALTTTWSYYFQGARVDEDTFELRLYKKNELISLLKNVGFVDIELIERSNRYYVLARKKRV